MKKENKTFKIIVVANIIICLTVLLLTSCKKEEVKNCACNKLIKYSYYYTYDDNNNQTSYDGYIVTENECSSFIDTVLVSGYTNEPKELGSCY